MEYKAVVTDPSLVFSIDLKTITTEQLAYSEPFSLQVRRNDYVHALISWFDIEFTACHKPIQFSTGPHAKYTHWKQTVFYLKETLTVEAGETIQGRLSSKPTKENPRDLDVKIEYEFLANDSSRSSSGVCDYRMC